MDEKLQEAISLYNKGKKAQAYKLLDEIVRQDPNNSVAWYGLALCLNENDKKIYCLQRTLSLDPTNQKAKQLLEQLLLMKKQLGDNQSLSANWLAVYALGVIGIVVLVLFLLIRNQPYKPTADDAFSYAAGYALSDMYARDPVNYWCGESETKKAAYWYQIQVSELGNGKYYVIGATKAIDQYCVYETGYFATTIRYDYENERWDLEGDIYLSNSCLNVGSIGGECTMWKYDWVPDMNWRPPNK